MDQVPRSVQTGRVDARHECQRQGTRPTGGLPHDPQMNGAINIGEIGDVMPPATAASEKTVLDHIHSWLVTVDHKKLGLMYIMYGLGFLVVAGLQATLIRVQLAAPNLHIISPQAFNQLFTMHGTTMVFLAGMPLIFGFANYLVPIMIGARDLAFP